MKTRCSVEVADHVCVGYGCQVCEEADRWDTIARLRTRAEAAEADAREARAAMNEGLAAARRGHQELEAKLAEATDIIQGLVRAYSCSEAAVTEERLTAISRGVMFLVPGAPEPPLPAAHPAPATDTSSDHRGGA